MNVVGSNPTTRSLYRSYNGNTPDFHSGNAGSTPARCSLFSICVLTVIEKGIGLSDKLHQCSIEILYHFNCVSCKKWWSIGDWKRSEFLSCPNCGRQTGVELKQQELDTSKKEILHQVLKGMCGYLSCGVPDPYWDLAKQLVAEVYGDEALKLLEEFHSVYDSSEEITLHSIDGWEDGGNTHVGPEELIEKLEKGL